MVDSTLHQRNNKTLGNGTSSSSSTPHHMLTIATDAPVTYILPIHTELDSKIDKPYMARACAAISIEHPHGSSMRQNETNKTVLQQHCEFFDTNHDNILTMNETYHGFRAIGFNILSSVIAAFCIHLSTSYGTATSYWPDIPWFRINLNNIHRAKHGSDSGVYDEQGRFVPYKFEDMFLKFDREEKGGLYWDELVRMAKSQRNALDFAGWAAVCTEWGFTWLLCGDNDKNMMHKDDIRKMVCSSVM